jgi:RalA-binding protein 1
MPQADEHQQQRPAVALSSSTSANQTPSSSSTNVASTPSNTSQPLTIDALLNATPNRDPLIALESILAERNSLAAQNAQLWKLIEKQRTMYNNATREIERLKASAERNGSSAGDGLAASTSSNTSRRAESQQRGDDRTQRAKVARTNSDDQGAFLSLPLLK